MIRIFLICILYIMSFAHPPATKIKNTLIVFEGSDWCASCRKFESIVLKDNTVVEYFEKNNIDLVKVDFPQRKKLSKEEISANELMAKKYDFMGVFPTVVFVSSSDEKYYTFHSDKTTPAVFIEWIENHKHVEDD